LHWGVARTRAALGAVAAVALAGLVVSGGSSSDPRTPAALPGLPPPFLTTAVLGDGGLTAGVDSYGDVVDLGAPGPAGAALIDNPVARQEAGTVPADTGIVPRVSVGGGPAGPFWRADWVRQRYLPGTNVLRTAARFGDARVTIECAARGGRLGCLSGGTGSSTRVSFDGGLDGGGAPEDGDAPVHLDDDAARRIVAAAAAGDRRWLSRARPLAEGAPAWARRLYARSLLTLRALTDRHSGAVAAGARDGWAFVWPRDASASALALAAAGYRPEARRVARFLLGLDLNAAARFAGNGAPVPGRAAQGDALGWAAAAARATGLPRAARLSSPARRDSWRNRADYQEKSPGDYLANAIASTPTTADGPQTSNILTFEAHRPGLGGVVRRIGDPSSGLDSAAAWAVRPFPHPALFPAVRVTLDRLVAESGRFGIVPSEDWPDAAPWTAPTAWSAWSLATLSRLDDRSPTAARDRADALRLLGDLRRASTPAGLLPERVDARSGVPLSTTPLAWSHAFAILAIRQLWPGPPHMLGR
jgi:glucoamylase